MKRGGGVGRERERAREEIKSDLKVTGQFSEPR